jgi:hypothetical protein
MNATLEAPRPAPSARLAPPDGAVVPLRVAGGFVRRARRVQVYIPSGACARVSKAAALAMLRGMRRRGKRTVEGADPFGEGVVILS